MPAFTMLDTGSPIPLYYQLHQQLRQQIMRGDLTVGALLPAEEDLAANLGVSRATVRQAIAGLVQEGLLERRRNRGTRVTAPPVRQSLAGFYSFAHAMTEMRIDQHSRVISLRLGDAPANAALSLATGGADVVILERLRFVGETPLILETCWFLQEVGRCLFGADLTTASLYDLLEAGGTTIDHASETIRPIVLDERQADLLDLATCEPAFFVERTSHARQRPVELRHSVIRGDRYLYSVDLPRPALRRDGERQERQP